jgi:hypothetical protein
MSGDKPGARRLRRMLAWNHDLAVRMVTPEFPLASLEQLQSFQLARIAKSYEDLIASEGYAEGVNFFLSELYGGLDFRKRDQDMGKVMPVMIRFLTDKVLMTMSEAFELQAISLAFDMDMADWMHTRSVTELDMESYCAVYRACSEREGRERQIHLIRKLGYDLDRLVHKPMVNVLVRLLRGPAHAAGFGALQEFLETGLSSFRALPDAGYFVETIYDREWQAMCGMFAGEARPFEF